jgi:DNA polymerase-3 subunit epsilon
MHYAIVDIETTGGSPKDSKITEIAIYKHDGQQIIGEYTSLVNPEMKIPAFIVRLTGIKDEMVANAPRFFEIAKSIIEFTEDCIFVAHNVGFDYGILRHEFKSLGYDFRRPHLCTVRASRYVLPGFESYSLGKLTRSLGIEINGRHRAGGDALATAHLFTLLVDKDPSGLQTFIQEEVNPKILHPNLDLETLDALPSKIGVYSFYNEVNQLIYIGKSKQIKGRVDQHLRNSSTKKGIQMRNEITRISYELTGSELVALLRESQLIKTHQPLYNQKLKKTKFPYGIFDYFDEMGYHRLYIALTSKQATIPLLSFTTKKEANHSLEKLCEKHALCQKLCDLYTTKTACFQYTIKTCAGACIQKESVELYNAKVAILVQSLYFDHQTFYIIDKGRHKNEKSLVYVERGSIAGFGFAPFNFRLKSPSKWQRHLELTSEDRDARTILRQYLRSNKEVEIVYV